MTATNKTLIGHVIEVCSDGLTANIIADEQETTPKVTVGDEDILIGQLGSYVSVRQGNIKILCLITRMVEQEKLADGSSAMPNAPVVTYAQRTISLIPIGTITNEGQFERGVSMYPTTGAKVHVVSGAELDSLFSKFRAKGYEVGDLSSQPSLKVCLEPSKLFGRHFTILGQTGAGKSWSVASLIQRALIVMPRAHIIILTFMVSTAG